MRVSNFGKIQTICFICVRIAIILHDSEIFAKILRKKLSYILTFFATFRTFCRKSEMLLPESRVISSVDAALAAVIAALTAIIAEVTAITTRDSGNNHA